MKVLEQHHLKSAMSSVQGKDVQLHQVISAVVLRELIEDLSDELITRERISRQDCDNARKVKDSVEEHIQAGMVMAIGFIHDRIKKRFKILLETQQ